MLLFRNKKDTKIYQNAPVVGGKVLVYKHTFELEDDHVGDYPIHEWEFVAGDGKVYPIRGQPIQSKEESEILYFRAPHSLSSTQYRRHQIEEKAVEPCVVLGYDTHDATSLNISSGDAYAKTARHTGATKPGWCGALVLSQTGEVPRLMGFHLYGDNNTKTNGYVPLSEGLNDEIKTVRFSKN